MVTRKRHIWIIQIIFTFQISTMKKIIIKWFCYICFLKNVHNYLKIQFKLVLDGALHHCLISMISSSLSTAHWWFELHRPWRFNSLFTLEKKVKWNGSNNFSSNRITVTQPLRNHLCVLTRHNMIKQQVIKAISYIV